jgi:hypothetical protein
MNSIAEIVSPKELEYLINEIETLKTNYNNIELQLYEANEKISDMIEQVWWVVCLLVQFHVKKYIFNILFGFAETTPGTGKS